MQFHNHVSILDLFSFRLTVRIMISDNQRKNSYLNIQVTLGLKFNFVIIFYSRSHLQFQSYGQDSDFSLSKSHLQFQSYGQDIDLSLSKKDHFK
ncbi:hypothetical protein C0J52_06853 [Blattella germanica]|nr:hypothetical protein C0J52_06853 [Blattella germanica]